MCEEKCCCNCLHCARWRTKNGVECHCDLSDKYLGYLDVMDEDNHCKNWEKETKWDLFEKALADERRKFAEWLTKSDYAKGYFDTGSTYVSVDKVLAEYEKQMKETEEEK